MFPAQSWYTIYTMLTGDALVDFLDLAVRGYTVSRLRELMRERGHDLRPYADAALINLLLECRAEVEQARETLDRDTELRFGLRNRLERVRRLCEAAERVEVKSHTDYKWMAEYRQLVAQIQREVEPLGIEIRPGDAWADLIKELTALGRPVDEGTLDTEGADPGEDRGRALGSPEASS